MIRLFTIFLLLFCFKAQATVYTLAQSGNWSDPASWNPNGVPGSGDDVVINDPGLENSLTVTLTGNVTINSLTYNGHYLRNLINGTGKLTLSTNSTWYGGVLSGSMELEVSSGVTLALNQASDTGNRKVLESNAKVTNEGTVTWGGNGIYFYDNALIDNNNQFINNTGANRLYSESNSATVAFTNDGTFTNNSPDFESTIHFENKNTVNVSTGHMRFLNRITNSGTINLNASGASPHKFTGYSGGSGILHFGTNTTAQFDDNSIIGTITGTIGTLAFVDEPSPNGSMVTVNTLPAGFLLDFSDARTVTFNVLNYTLANSVTFPSNMVLNGSGKIAVPNGLSITWDGGRIEGSIELIVKPGAQVSLAMNNNKEINETAKLTIENGGSLEYTGSGGLVLGNSAQIVNAGSINIDGDLTIFDNSNGSTSIDNSGSINKISGAGTSQIQPSVTNSGIVNVQSGTINFFRDLTNFGTLKGLGTLSFAGSQPTIGGTIAPGLSPGTLTLDGNRSFSGVLLMELDGNTTDKLVVNGTLNLSGATITVTELSALPLHVGFTLIEATSIQNFNPASVNLPSGYEVNFIGNEIIVSNGPLPVELTTFTGQLTDAGNRLHWETASETNTNWHIIERSGTGSGWEEIGRLPAAGTSLEHQAYDYLDNRPLPLSYYRLRTEDLDGSFEISKVIVLERSEGRALTLNVFPNPVAEMLSFEIYTPEIQGATLRLIDHAGRILRKEEFSTSEGILQKSLMVGDLTPGAYLLEIESPGGRVVRQFLKK